jgi:hypothetical protein
MPDPSLFTKLRLFKIPQMYGSGKHHLFALVPSIPHSTVVCRPQVLLTVSWNLDTSCFLTSSSLTSFGLMATTADLADGAYTSK